MVKQTWHDVRTQSKQERQWIPSLSLGAFCKWLSFGTPAFLLNFIFVVTKEKRQYFCLTCTREDFKRQCVVLELGMWLILSDIPFPYASSPPDPPPSLMVIALPAISRQQFCLCSVSVCQKEQPVNFMICHTSASLQRTGGDWARTSLSLHSFLSTPARMEPHHISVKQD